MNQKQNCPVYQSGSCLLYLSTDGTAILFNTLHAVESFFQGIVAAMFKKSTNGPDSSRLLHASQLAVDKSVVHSEY